MKKYILLIAYILCQSTMWGMEQEPLTPFEACKQKQAQSPNVKKVCKQYPDIQESILDTYTYAIMALTSTPEPLNSHQYANTPLEELQQNMLTCGKKVASNRLAMQQHIPLLLATTTPSIELKKTDIHKLHQVTTAFVDAKAQCATIKAAIDAKKQLEKAQTHPATLLGQQQEQASLNNQIQQSASQFKCVQALIQQKSPHTVSLQKTIAHAIKTLRPLEALPLHWSPDKTVTASISELEKQIKSLSQIEQEYTTAVQNTLQELQNPLNADNTRELREQLEFSGKILAQTKQEKQQLEATLAYKHKQQELVFADTLTDTLPVITSLAPILPIPATSAGEIGHSIQSATSGCAAKTVSWETSHPLIEPSHQIILGLDDEDDQSDKEEHQGPDADCNDTVEPSPVLPLLSLHTPQQMLANTKPASTTPSMVNGKLDIFALETATSAAAHKHTLQLANDSAKDTDNGNTSPIATKDTKPITTHTPQQVITKSNMVSTLTNKTPSFQKKSDASADHTYTKDMGNQHIQTVDKNPKQTLLPVSEKTTIHNSSLTNARTAGLVFVTSGIIYAIIIGVPQKIRGWLKARYPQKAQNSLKPIIAPTPTASLIG